MAVQVECDGFARPHAQPRLIVIAGGVIPVQDYDFLYKAGVAAIFGPGTNIMKSAIQIMEILNDVE